MCPYNFGSNKEQLAREYFFIKKIHISLVYIFLITAKKTTLATLAWTKYKYTDLTDYDLTSQVHTLI